MNNFIDTTVSSNTSNINELVSINTPSSIFDVDEAQRQRVRSLSGKEQTEWANKVTARGRNELISAQDMHDQLVNQIATFENTINEAYSGQADAILGYANFQDYLKAEFSELKMIKSREARGQIVQAFKQANMSTRVIASLLNVGVATVHRDLQSTMKAASGQVFHSGTPVHEENASVQVFHNGTPEQSTTSISLDRKTYSDKRGAELIIRDYLEIMYLTEVEGKSRRQAAEELGIPHATANETMHAYNDKHDAINSLFVRARLIQLDPDQSESIAYVADQLGLSVHGAQWLTDPKGWADKKYHKHGDYTFLEDGTTLLLRDHIACEIITPASIYEWLKAPVARLSPLVLQYEDENGVTQRSETSLTRLGEICHASQETLSYQFNEMRKEWRQYQEDMVAQDALEQSQKNYEQHKNDTPAATSTATAIPVSAPTSAPVVASTGAKELTDEGKLSHIASMTPAEAATRFAEQDGWMFLPQQPTSIEQAIHDVWFSKIVYKSIQTPATYLEYIRQRIAFKLYSDDNQYKHLDPEFVMSISDFAKSLMEPLEMTLSMTARIKDIRLRLDKKQRDEYIRLAQNLKNTLDVVIESMSSETPRVYSIDVDDAEDKRLKAMQEEEDELKDLMEGF
ncbi:hypothetical protein ACFQY8_07620 [Alloscardovia venturai]|uniref:DNA-binding protein n=1 Tax=Alloscardovia venturai TaxID=1769421 RepID=A0ABW2Y5R4_9BIFI